MKNKIASSPQEKYLIIGDMNARFGNSRCMFLQGKDLPPSIRYRTSPDTVTNPNHNARYIASSFGPSLVMLNCLSIGHQHFSGDLTFRQGPRWISELDICLLSPEYLEAVTEFAVHQSPLFPSDHAPISLNIDIVRARAAVHGVPGDMEEVIERSTHLGRQSVTNNAINAQMKGVPIRMNQIDDNALRDALNTMQPPPLDPFSPDQTAEEVNNVLYACAWNARREEFTREDAPDATQNRWQTLLAENDSKALWKAISWNGSIADATQRETPSDDAFKQHFELLLNPARPTPTASLRR